MTMTLSQLFDGYCTLDDQQARMEFACVNPALISSVMLPQIQKMLENEDGEQRHARMERLIELDALRRFIAQSAGRYPAGKGPIERIAQQVADGEISMAAATEQVQRPEFKMQLAPLYVHALTYHAELLATAGQSATALLWERLLAEACMAACQDEKVDEPLKIAGIGFIQIAGVTLGPNPDGELLHAAVALGSQLQKRFKSANDTSGQADVLHAMGALYSDPFTSTSGSGVQALDHRAWLQRLEAGKGSILAQRHLERHPLPTAKEALEKAIDYFEQALPLRKGVGRGITIKALAQTLVFAAQSNNTEIDRTRLQKLCTEALQLLEPGDYHHAALVALMHSINLKVEGEMPGTATGDTPDAVFQQAAALQQTNPAQAFQVLADAEEIFAMAGTESQRDRRLAAMLQFIPILHGGDLRDEFKDIAAENAAQMILEMAQTQQWNDDRTSATLISLALRTRKTDEEEMGLRLLQIATQHSPKIAGYHAPVAYLYVQLSVGAAVNALDANNVISSVQFYAQALAPCVRLRLHAKTFELLKRIADLASRPDEEMLLNIILGLAPVALEIDRELGPAGNEALQAVYQSVFSSIGETVNANSIGMLLQLAKGVRFGTILRHGTGFDWRADGTSTEFLHRIALLEKQIAAPTARSTLDDLLLVSPFSSMRAVGGSAPAERLLNLQQTFDHYITSRMTGVVRKSAIMQPEVVQQQLGSRTVLLDYYFVGQGEKRSMYIISYTDTEVRGFRNLLRGESEAFVLDQERTEAVLDFLGLLTMRVRRTLQLDPADGLIHSEAAQALKNDFEFLLGRPTWDYLESLRQAGKDHLCIRPHGALRYYPMHLLGPGNDDLAQHWILTWIPSLECLLPQATEKRSIPGLALGLTYGGGKPFRLPELKSARAEVESIAEIFGTEPLLDGMVTEQRVKEALLASRRIHLCAHGAHNAGLPLFQHLFVTPNSESDGRVYAYEILGLDLRGLEVLTLGVCDSALGRFDAGDNLSGLPASFLTAGTSAIVASLWEMLDKAAQIFFVRFYRELAHGVNRLDAFRKAQLDVRSACPEPRDWGAFCYLGDWDRDVDPLPSDFEPYIPLGQ